MSAATFTSYHLDYLAERIAAQLRADRDQLLTKAELAARLRLSVRQVSRLVRRGLLPAGYRVGRVRRWSWRRVERFLAGRSARRRRQSRNPERSDETTAGSP